MPAEASNNNGIEMSDSEANSKLSLGQQEPAPQEIQIDVQILTSNEVLKEKLEHAFGVAIDSDDGIDLEFSTSPEALLNLQSIIQSGCYACNGDLPFILDEIIMQAVYSIKPNKSTMETNTMEELAKAYNNNRFISCMSSSAPSIFNYLSNCFMRCNTLLQKVADELAHKVLTSLRERVKVQTVLFLRGLLSMSCSHQDVSTFVAFSLLNSMTEQTSYFLAQLIACCKDPILTDEDALTEVFSPVLTILRSCVQCLFSNMKFSSYSEMPYKALSYLLDIKLADNTRPISELLVSRPDFHPKILLSEYRGREFISTSYLGPFISLSIVTNQFEDLCFEDADTVFPSAEMDRIQKEQKISTYRSQLAIIRDKLHSLFRCLVVNPSTRRRTLTYIADVFKENRKLSQLQADYTYLTGCPAMLNLFSVMLNLSSKILVEKIQNDYIFHPDSLAPNVKEEARIKMDSNAAEKYRLECDLSYAPNFNTEFFHLTIEIMRISLSAMISTYSQLKRSLGEIRRRVRELEERAKNSSSNNLRTSLQRAKDLQTKFMQSDLCYECLVYDESLLVESINFVNKLFRLLLRSVMPDFGQQQETFSSYNQRFLAFPESYLEVGVDLLHFLLRKPYYAKIFLQNQADYPKQVLHLILNLSNIQNPFMASKIADLLFYLCPPINPDAIQFYRQVVNDPHSVEGVFPVLVKFYADVESTGSHNEFYDKFNIRRNIQVIFKCLWKDLAHRDRMVQFAGESSPNFYRFINMVINDTTFLLDESLDKLKKVHEIESQMASEMEWNKLSEDERQKRTGVLQESKGQVKIWLELGSETMELFTTLTNDAPQIFRQEALGERVAAMLNHNLVQLCGPKCAQLKVHDASSRFNWNPRRLAEQIVQVYINLSSELFAQQISQDERSYTPETFKEILVRFRKHDLLTVNHFELFKNLAEQAEASYSERVKFEEEFEDEIPEEFKDALVYTLMSDPMVLPSGQVCDRKNILRHLLSDPTNPFTRQPLTEDELQSDEELKARIKSWVEEMKRSKRANS